MFSFSTQPFSSAFAKGCAGSQTPSSGSPWSKLFFHSPCKPLQIPRAGSRWPGNIKASPVNALNQDHFQMCWSVWSQGSAATCKETLLLLWEMIWASFPAPKKPFPYEQQQTDQQAYPPGYATESLLVALRSHQHTTSQVQPRQ